ncbi:MAG: ribonucleoside reductase class II [Chloroflexi bacterium]|nr:MAG: ribonucleoside reductase class II [Chloroflexota bacterium]
MTYEETTKFEMMRPREPVEARLSPNAMAVLKRRYLRKGADRQPVETVEQMFHRVSSHVASVEGEWGQDVAAVEAIFYDLITDFRFMPNSPTFTGAGTPLGQLAACFVLPISDDMGRERDGIFQTLRDMALIQQTGGGTGFSFSKLRPKGAVVRSSGGRATGPVGFMHVYDVASEIVSQGGTRRGANMAVMRVDHPDVREFIRCKTSEGAISNFNISIGVTDAFMRAVEEDEAIDLINPQDGQVWDTVSAREIFDQIVTSAHRNGEPGVLFLDAVNRDNPTPHLGDYEATNPCVAGDTLIYTARGIYRADELAACGASFPVVVDGRFGVYTLQEASPVFPTGVREVYRVRTKEGYELRLTANHRVMTDRGWVEARNLCSDDRVHILNRTGAFGETGSTELGLVLGWLVGDGKVSRSRAVLSFFGQEKVELAPSFANAVTSLVGEEKVNNRHYPVDPIEIPGRDEVRIQSERLRSLIAEQGLAQEKLQVPPSVWRGTREMQASFLRALFTADGTVLDGGDEGCSVRLTSVSYELLQDVQCLLLNFGVASKIYRERRSAGKRMLPDGKGGYAEYFCQAYHELVISGDNLIRFSEQIGFLTEQKQVALSAYLERVQRGPYRERFTARVESVEFVGREMVYDLSQPTTRSFIANGVVVHNCGEQPLLPYENCCLGSVNLARHVRYGHNGRPVIDWDKLQETVEVATRFLDDVINANAYLPAVPQLEEAALRTRRIGLGIMGLGDILYHLRVRYGSDEAQELAAQVMEFIRYHAMRTSIELARERGPFPAIEGSIYDPDDVRWTPPQPLAPYTRLERWNRLPLDWEAIDAGIRRYGIRNATQTTVAPTGTTATVAGCEAYGCEPVFALAYTRYMNDNGQDVELRYVSPLFLQALERAGLDEEERERIVQQVLLTGSCQEVENVPEAIRRVFVVAGDVSAEEHVRMQAALQAFVDASISKTINLPADATPDDVAHAFRLAWELGCKGLTVYVTGSRENEVLETEKTRREKREARGVMVSTKVRPRPHSLGGRTYRLKTPLGTAYTTVNVNGDGEPFEVFLNVGKAGSDTAAVAEAIGRLVSLILRIPSPLSATRRLKQVVRQLKGIGGGRSLGFGRDRVRSLPDGVAQVLAEHLGMAEPVSEEGEGVQLSLFAAGGDLCPECGHAAVVNTEGCRRCYSCGYSEC